MKIKIGIVENELLIAENICLLLEELGYDAFEPVTNYTEAIEMIELQGPDLLLLDIQLGGKKDGIELAAVVNEKYHIPFIYITANADLATVGRAKQTHPSAFIVKPFSKEELFTAIEICLFHSQGGQTVNLVKGSHDHIFVRVEQGLHKLLLSDILRIEGDNNYISIYTVGGNYAVRATLQSFLDAANSTLFKRVHKSNIVNVTRITSIAGDKVVLGRIEAPVSKQYKDTLLDYINII